ncbi:hypothetical protein ABWH98_16120 [Labrenzia sp. ac12]
MQAASTIEISPTPFQSLDQSLPMEWDLLPDGGRGGGKTYAVILEVFRAIADACQPPDARRAVGA